MSSTAHDTNLNMASQTVTGSLTSGNTVFELTLEEFKKVVKPDHVALFQTTTLETLLVQIDDLQETQNKKRRLLATARLKPTLEALRQLGKVVEVFANSSEYVAFVWVCTLLPVDSLCARHFFS